MRNDLEELVHPALRHRRLVIRCAVLTIWSVGVVLAIKSGWDPGPWWRRSGRPWPYPLGEVLTQIAKITLISLGLYDLLRPQSEGSSLARTARATGVLLFTLVWIATTTWMDQPGYAYATGGYVFIVTGLLFLALISHLVLTAVRRVRRRRHAA